MNHTPSPIAATSDQAETIRVLTTYGAQLGIDVDAGPIDEIAREKCSNDWAHGPATVCAPDEPDRICPSCAQRWLYWHDGPLVAVDILQTPPPAAAVAA